MDHDKYCCAAVYHTAYHKLTNVRALYCHKTKNRKNIVALYGVPSRKKNNYEMCCDLSLTRYVRGKSLSISAALCSAS